MRGGVYNYTDKKSLVTMHAFVDEQNEWVVCRVFQKSAGVKKYPTSNQSRAVNPYNLEIGAAMMQADNYHFSMGRNYAELAELSRVLRGAAGGPGTCSTNVNLPIQSQINYLGPGGFTISGLKLNLGGASTQPVMRPMQPPPPPSMHQQDSLMSTTTFTAENGYGAVEGAEINHNTKGSANRYLSIDHCMDLDNYWPSY
ncbi:hypothetical protein REPUB_Repub18cG0174100 [Reevesia pubescens]